jgi:hypothetical protein
MESKNAIALFYRFGFAKKGKLPRGDGRPQSRFISAQPVSRDRATPEEGITKKRVAGRFRWV